MRAVQIPALVIHGTEDIAPVEGGEEWVRALPDARLVRVAGAGHLPRLEEPGLVFGAIDRFLRGEWPEEAVPVDPR
jgi:pimeloyl-ACP methyl ester carboxylesterase